MTSEVVEVNVNDGSDEVLDLIHLGFPHDPEMKYAAYDSELVVIYYYDEDGTAMLFEDLADAIWADNPEVGGQCFGVYTAACWGDLIWERTA